MGILALVLAIPIAFLIDFINKMFIGTPEKVVMILGVLFVTFLSLPPIIYILLKRRDTDLGILSLITLTTVGILLVSIYLYWVSSYIRFPADILIWSESDFVNDILKFRIGYPLYTAQVNNESFAYVPGPQLLTYFLAWLSGNPTSIPAYRLIQVFYTLIAVLFAFISFVKLLELSDVENKYNNWRLWGAFGIPFLFLIATNSLTNPFVQNLHDDALAQLVSIIAYSLLLIYTSTRNKSVLAIMAFLPGISFLVKQSLIIWAVFYCIQLGLFDRQLSIKQLIVFSAVSFASIGFVIAGCYIMWGDPFIYWIFTVLGAHSVSILRSLKHALDVWIYYSLGLLGGVMLVKGKNFSRLLGLWLIWLLLISQETYTSGIAWMINHIGPGSLIAGVWFLTAFKRVWPNLFHKEWSKSWSQPWLQTGIAIIVFCFLFSGLGVIRIPLPALGEDAYRYISDIENQFKGQDASGILLDFGTWVYIKDGIVMKDRAPSIGERGYSETGDFSGIIQRLQQRKYEKILVRDLNSLEFTYDYWLWRKSSGIKQALLANYHVIGKINGVNGINNYLFDEISILVPN